MEIVSWPRRTNATVVTWREIIIPVVVAGDASRMAKAVSARGMLMSCRKLEGGDYTVIFLIAFGVCRNNYK